LKNSLRAAQGCAAIFQARGRCLKNGAKKKIALFALRVEKAHGRAFSTTR
jgi:hypothetical protein